MNAEEAFDYMQHPFMIKIIHKLETEGKYPKLIKDIHEKPTAYIIFNGERRWKAFPLKLGTRQSFLLLALTFTVTLKVLTRVSKQHRKIKFIQTVTGENKITSVSRWYNLKCRKPKVSTMTATKKISEIKAAEYKGNIPKSVPFL